MSTTRRKPKWWNIDWVELGCRGWDIDVTGAGLGEDGELDWPHAHLEPDTLHLIVCGKPAFVAQVLNDMVAAKAMRITEKSDPLVWNMVVDLGGLGVCWPGAYTGDTVTAGSGGQNLRLVS